MPSSAATSAGGPSPASGRRRAEPCPSPAGGGSCPKGGGGKLEHPLVSAEQRNSLLVLTDKALFKRAAKGCKVAKRERRPCSWADAQFAWLRAAPAAGLRRNRALRSSPRSCRLLTKN
ncbi:hypothetical protein XAP412_470001 [Xanthomonas phaseoli pv. phaseoli]|nr:hypothetical protein XAP6984_520001 [Xanthomonas phaseoli pv. phaseoli]SON86180.1 hypothetical protein XAP412_470001 [Xanthomonas phaseoli pv. phaseoli]